MTFVPRVAIVSDALVQNGGAERVLSAMADAFPDAPIYTPLYSPTTGPASLAPRIRASWLNRVPGATRRHRAFFPFYRDAVESFDLRSFDTIVSSHHTVAKGLLRNADQVHVCYCHTPMRGMWERSNEETALLPAPLKFAVRRVYSHLRTWDVATANHVDIFLANSRTTQRRIAKHYRRESTVLEPPVDLAAFTPGGDVGDYYLVASRAVAHKRHDVAIGAARLAGRRLLIVGQRPRGFVSSPESMFLGHVDDHELVRLMRGARALIFPQYEDFGLTVVETNACGRPVVAYGAGGALETVVDGVTGVLVPEQTPEAFAAALYRLEATNFDTAAIRQHALRFDRARFIDSLRDVVANARDRIGRG